MKINLEFESWDEYQLFLKSRGRRKTDEDDSYIHPKDTGTMIPRLSRRKRWSDYEVAFLKENYMIKSVRWISSALGKKQQNVQNKLFQLYKAGLPKKRSRSGKTKEE